MFCLILFCIVSNIVLLCGIMLYFLRFIWLSFIWLLMRFIQFLIFFNSLSSNIFDFSGGLFFEWSCLYLLYFSLFWWRDGGHPNFFVWLRHWLGQSSWQGLKLIALRQIKEQLMDIMKNIFSLKIMNMIYYLELKW